MRLLTLIVLIGITAWLLARPEPQPVSTTIVVYERERVVERVLVPDVPSRGDSKTLRLTATGYTAGPESTGKRPGDPGYGVTFSGLPAAPGACAVDPAVIALGSVLYVPGYGYAVAVDTGSVVRGKRVDLFFEDVEMARRWGVREVEAEVVSGWNAR